MEWIDITVPLREGMVHWPGDAPVQVKRLRSIGESDTLTLSEITLGSHSGTHIDAPLHFLQDGVGVDKMSFDTTIGPAHVIEIHDTKSIRREELAAYDIQSGDRILFKTINSERCWKTDSFIKDYVFLSMEAAAYLVDKGIRLVGIDYLSIGGYQSDGIDTHKVPLQAGIWILEGLDLSQVKEGKYELICLPLKIEGCDGSPVRAILKPIPVD